MKQMEEWITQLADREQRDRAAHFVAPRVRGGEVEAILGGLRQRLQVQPESFEGWGIFRYGRGGQALLLRRADALTVERFCGLLPASRLILGEQLRGTSWLAYPAQAEAHARRFGSAKPVVVHLVDGGQPFDTVIARALGSHFWAERLDTTGDPVLADRLRRARAEAIPSESLLMRGLTPEHRTLYGLTVRPCQEDADSQRLQKALARSGGSLHGVTDFGSYWQVEWATSQGDTHLSAIGKSDLTVLSSGICLSDRDEDFDLTSLVGVIEAR